MAEGILKPNSTGQLKSVPETSTLNKGTIDSVATATIIIICTPPTAVLGCDISPYTYPVLINNIYNCDQLPGVRPEGDVSHTANLHEAPEHLKWEWGRCVVEKPAILIKSFAA